MKEEKQKTNHLQTLAEIKALMEQSSRFVSLSGISGVFVGLIAIAGALAVYLHLGLTSFSPTLSLTTPEKQFILIVAGLVLLLSLVTSFAFSRQRAKKNNHDVWSPAAKRLMINMMIPLVAGGIVLLYLLINDLYQLLIPIALLFYGVSLLNAGKFSLDEVRHLGILQIMTGLVALWFPEFGLFFWILGFGILHIIYGFLMYNKYER
jgi:hypothetical protein